MNVENRRKTKCKVTWAVLEYMIWKPGDGVVMKNEQYTYVTFSEQIENTRYSSLWIESRVIKEFPNADKRILIENPKIDKFNSLTQCIYILRMKTGQISIGIEILRIHHIRYSVTPLRDRKDCRQTICTERINVNVFHLKVIECNSKTNDICK